MRRAYQRLRCSPLERKPSVGAPSLGIALGVPEPLHVHDALRFIDAVSDEIGGAHEAPRFRAAPENAAT